MKITKFFLFCIFAINSFYGSATVENKDYTEARIGHITDGSSLELTNFPYNIYTENYFSFSSHIDSFKTLRLGQRQPDMKGDYLSACYLEINDSIISLKRVSREKDTTEFSRIYHQLDITDTISVNIFISSEMGSNISSLKSYILITTKNDTFDTPFDWYYGHNGAIFFESVNTLGTNGILSADCANFKRPVLIIGDSYMSVSPARWPYFIREKGYLNFIFDALSGATAWDTSFEIERLKLLVKPDYFLWFIGMNNPDPDDDTVQSSWMYNVTKVKSYCDENNIQLIISTIPNTPTRSHIAKNKWIKESNIRYIDFATAVNANDKNAKWYDGYLSTDNLHPTALGSQALANQLILDFPEIMELCHTSKTGDADNDGYIDIQDLNCIINTLLHLTSKYRFGNRTDVNNDKCTDISDINILVNGILNNSIQ